METIYNKAELTSTEQMALEAARQVLIKGDRLYGTSSKDVSHIEYAIGAVIATLTRLFEDKSIASLVEIGLDKNGFFVSIIRDEPQSNQE